jgi:SWIM zinc finger
MRSTSHRPAAVRPTAEQVLQLAGGASRAAAALSCADGSAWSAAGSDDEAVWGRYLASSAEPYEVAVDLTGPAFRCTCPSRKVPCKHALGLLLLHAEGGVVRANRLPFAAEWLRRRHAADEAAASPVVSDHEVVGTPSPEPDATSASRPVPVDRDRRLHERSERMRHGLRELDRWLADRIRAGLAAPELADRAEWEHLAARLVDAQCGGLANRVKRVATRIGQHPRWYEDVLEEMAVLHALAVGAQRTAVLPADLADGVHVATGLTTAKDDVLAGVPDTDRWVVAGESRVREDRITVQRTWLQAPGSSPQETPRWAMLLSFGAVGNEVSSPYPIGAAMVADVHWYPGGLRLRALVGTVHDGPSTTVAAPRVQPLEAALAAAGWAVAAEPWLERFPMCIAAVPTRRAGGRWAVADDTGAIPIAAGHPGVPELVSLAGGRPVRIMGEWGLDGFLPLVAWDGGRVISL